MLTSETCQTFDTKIHARHLTWQGKQAPRHSSVLACQTSMTKQLPSWEPPSWPLGWSVLVRGHHWCTLPEMAGHWTGLSASFRGKALTSVLFCLHPLPPLPPCVEDPKDWLGQPWHLPCVHAATFVHASLCLLLRVRMLLPLQRHCSFSCVPSHLHRIASRACGCGGPTLSPWPARPVGAACRGGGGGPSPGGDGLPPLWRASGVSCCPSPDRPSSGAGRRGTATRVFWVRYLLPLLLRRGWSGWGCGHSLALDLRLPF